MGRNKYPEQTLEKIVDTSTRLFCEKGYEQTSIQDILDALHLSKGGLYHHFKSKEEILEAVLNKRTQYILDMLHDLIENTEADNGKERLKKIIHCLLTDASAHALDAVMTSQVSNPYFVVSGLKTCVNQDAQVIAGLIQDGVDDGSIQTDNPKFCAEVFLMLFNFWINPTLFGRGAEETKERLMYLRSLMCLVGLDVIDDEFIDQFIEGYHRMGAYF